jgi:IS5 family transposase
MANIIVELITSWENAMLSVTTETQNQLFGDNPYELENTTKLQASLFTGWAQTFRDQVYLCIPGDEVGQKLFCSNNGRPSKDVTTSIGLLILQEFFDLTDAETVSRLRTDLSFHYALHINGPTDDSAYMVRRTFWDFKEKVRENKLDTLIFDRVTLGLAALNKVKVEESHIRLDSVHLKTNSKNLTRGGIFHATIHGFLDRLRKGNPEAFSKIDSSLTSKYLKDKTGYDVFGGSKPAERKRLLKSAANDLLTLVRMFENDDAVSGMEYFGNLTRILEEQCVVTPASDESSEEKVELKEPKEVPSDSLQNPSDPDVSYSGHKGVGIQAQIAETFSPAKEDGDETTKNLELILATKAEGAHKHDSEALKETVDALEAKGVTPKILTADTAYGGDENVEYAKSKGIDLISPIPGAKVDGKDAAASLTSEAESVEGSSDTEDNVTETGSGSFALDDFERDADDKIVSCPMGQEAQTCENRKGTGFIASFNLDRCISCPHKGKCPVKIGKRKARISYNAKNLRIAKRRKEHETPEFKKLYRKRSGIEATNSLLARKFHIKRLRVRGLRAAGFAITFKALACNVWRTASFVRQKMR